MFPFEQNPMDWKFDAEPQGGERRSRGHLELRQDRDGHRHYLEGRAVRQGDVIEIQLENGSWLRGTYNWRGIPVVWPALRLELAGVVSRSSDRKLSSAMPIPPSATLRWPT